MSTHDIQFHDKIRKNPLKLVFLNYQKNFVGTQKRVRIIQGKRGIGVRVIEILLYSDRYKPGRPMYTKTKLLPKIWSEYALLVIQSAYCRPNTRRQSKNSCLTFVLLNTDRFCFWKQCRSRSVGFWRSQLIWICAVCPWECEFISITWIKLSDWLKIRSGRGIFIYSAWQRLTFTHSLD